MESEGGGGMDGHFDASVISDSHTIDFRHLLAWYIYSPARPVKGVHLLSGITLHIHVRPGKYASEALTSNDRAI